jgi:hypothetical protein
MQTNGKPDRAGAESKNQKNMQRKRTTLRPDPFHRGCAMGFARVRSVSEIGNLSFAFKIGAVRNGPEPLRCGPSLRLGLIIIYSYMLLAIIIRFAKFGLLFLFKYGLL